MKLVCLLLLLFNVSTFSTTDLPRVYSGRFTYTKILEDGETAEKHKTNKSGAIKIFTDSKRIIIDLGNGTVVKGNIGFEETKYVNDNKVTYYYMGESPNDTWVKVVNNRHEYVVLSPAQRIVAYGRNNGKFTEYYSIDY